MENKIKENKFLKEILTQNSIFCYNEFCKIKIIDVNPANACNL